MIELTGKEPGMDLMTQALELAQVGVCERIREQRAVLDSAVAGTGGGDDVVAAPSSSSSTSSSSSSSSYSSSSSLASSATAAAWVVRPPSALKDYVLGIALSESQSMFQGMGT
jgi:hypothetical protein